METPRHSWGHHHAFACLLPPTAPQTLTCSQTGLLTPLSPTSQTLRSHVCELAPLVVVPVSLRSMESPNSAARPAPLLAGRGSALLRGGVSGWASTHLRGRLLHGSVSGAPEGTCTAGPGHITPLTSPPPSSFPPSSQLTPRHLCKVSMARAPCSPPF